MRNSSRLIRNTPKKASDSPHSTDAPWVSAANGTPDARFDAYWLEDAISRAIEGSDLVNELEQAQQRTEAFLSCRENGGTAPDCAIQVDPNYEGWRNAKQ